MKLRRKLKRIIPKLRRFKGIAWFTTVISFFTLVVYGYLINNFFYLKLANLIAFLYFVFSGIIAERKYQVIGDSICAILFLFFIFW